MKLDEAVRGLLEGWNRPETFNVEIGDCQICWQEWRAKWNVEVGDEDYRSAHKFGHVEDAIRAFCEMVEEQIALREERSEP